MEDLRAVHIELGTERSVRGDEVEKRRVRIEQTEKKVSLDSVVELANRVLTFLPDG
jgi:hypothetical protein